MDADDQQFVLETIRNIKIAARQSGNWFAIFDRDECMAGLDPVTWQDVDDPDSIERLAAGARRRRIRSRRFFR